MANKLVNLAVEATTFGLELTRQNNAAEARSLLGVTSGGGTSGVSSVNGKIDAVILTAADVGAATAAQGAKADTALQPGDAAGAITSVNGQTGVVVLTSADVGAATAAQGAKADTALQPGDIPAQSVTSVNTKTGAVVLTAADVGAATAAQGALATTAVQPGSLAAVATTGSYNSLSSLPTLGTAASQAASSFATAAQGTKADTAVQPAGLASAVKTPGSIHGLILSYKSAHVVTVSTGMAHNQSADSNYTQIADVDVTIPSTASAWFYLYQYGNNQIEQSTTAPAAPYFGTARSKAGDTTRRYLGAVMNDSSGNLLPFLQVGNEVHYLGQTDLAPFRALNAGTATAKTSVPLNAYGVPVGSRAAKLNVTNLGTDRALLLGNPDTATYISGVRQLSGVVGFFPLDASQNVSYYFALAPTSGAAYVDVVGYMLTR